MTNSEPRWLAWLRTEAAHSNITEVAQRIGYSRTTVSLVIAGKYPGKIDRIAHTVTTMLEARLCPHLQQPVSEGDCQIAALGPAPTHHPMKLGHWRSCQRCSYRPKGA
ncbi:transcriptional regulator [Paludibacterium yongneupense]|uniref:transcriptional regulator n=1 Tax=Paludibacterium yongneupense TaxID=400061 RepID=UPI00041CE734|nr:transcriptional regulator [Paludibacterium yongneupense]